MSQSNYCNQLDGTPLEKVIDRHYRERTKVLKALGTGIYPNMDFVSKFTQYLYTGDIQGIDCLCNVAAPLVKEDEFSKGKMGTAYILKYGDIKYVMKIIEGVTYKQYLSVVIHKYSELDTSYMAGHSILTKHTSLTKDYLGTIKDRIIVVEADPFSNQTCINMIISTILHHVPYYVNQLDAFYCKTNTGYRGVNIMELAEFDNISKYFSILSQTGKPITEYQIVDILHQVTIPLFILKQDRYGFSHNDMKTKNVFVAGDALNPIYKIADFDKSSIFWNKVLVRHTARDTLASWLSTGYHGFPTKLHETKNKGIRRFYNLFLMGGLTDMKYVDGYNMSLIMNSWIPMFPSHDIYTFIVSLLCEPYVWRTISMHITTTTSTSITYVPKFKASRIMRIIESLFIDQVDKFLLHMIDVHSSYTSGNIDTDYLLSIRNANTILSNFDLLIDISDYYSIVGVSIDHNVQTYITPYTPTQSSIPMIMSKDRHICTSPCINDVCETNTYSKTHIGWTGLYVEIHNKDTCKV